MTDAMTIWLIISALMVGTVAYLMIHVGLSMLDDARDQKRIKKHFAKAREAASIEEETSIEDETVDLNDLDEGKALGLAVTELAAKTEELREAQMDLESMTFRVSELESDLNWQKQRADQDVQAVIKKAHVKHFQMQEQLSIVASELKEVKKELIAAGKEEENSHYHADMSKNLAPLLMDGWDFGDYRHSGEPVDFIVYRGYTDMKARRRTDIEEIVLLDIKTGGSKMTTRQRRIRDAVVAGKVSFACYNVDTGKLQQWPVNVDA